MTYPRWSFTANDERIFSIPQSVVIEEQINVDKQLPHINPKGFNSTRVTDQVYLHNKYESKLQVYQCLNLYYQPGHPLVLTSFSLRCSVFEFTP